MALDRAWIGDSIRHLLLRMIRCFHAFGIW
jgi:hypothetical protein